MKTTFSSAHRAAVGVAVVAAAVGAFYGAKALVVGRLASAQVSVIPFVVQRDIYFYGPGQTRRLAKIETIARASDGTEVVAGTFGPVSAGLIARKITYPDSSVVGLIDAARVKTTWPPSRRDAAFLKSQTLNPPPNCVRFSNMEALVSSHAAVLGHPADEIRHGALGAETLITTWRARDLGCADLEYRAETRQADGSYKLTSFTQAVSLEIGEPSAGLLNPGTGYREVSPSEWEKAGMRIAGVTHYPTWQVKRWAQLDRQYDQAHGG